jgi:hypothetical protein
MTAPAPSLKRRLGHQEDVPERRDPRTPRTVEGLHRVEIITPDPECAALLLQYASPMFPAKLVTGVPLIVRLQPPQDETRWVIELLALVERWLESASLPYAKGLYGGRSYLIRSSQRVAQYVTEPAPAVTS